MDARFRHYLKISTVWHVIAVLVLIIAPLIANWHFRRKNRNVIMMMDLTVAMPEIPAAAVAAAEPKQPDVKKDIPEPAKPKPKPKIEKSTKLVKRPDAPKPKTPPLSAEEIRKLLAAGARISDQTSVPSDEFPFAWYYALVRQTMYEAWEQPSDLAGKAGLMTEVTVRVLRDGTVTQRSMTRGSGNSIMDDSVMKAVNRVTTLRALPPQFSGPYKDILIEFELARGGM
jgi:TonB family protein